MQIIEDELDVKMCLNWTVETNEKEEANGE